jgi:hypothetical protein
MTDTPGHRVRLRTGTSLTAMMLTVAAFAPAAAAQSSLPEIRMTASNQVPTCVTPDRLMAFLRTRNSNPDPRFQSIAEAYKKYGEGWRIRWDYAFFQMAVETNFLTYKQGNGRWGDVNPKQNNFAGIGTTGGGVPGDSFADVKTGVLGHIQHLVAYSGERVADPVAPRTKLKQDDIIELSEKLNRPVTFKDLARRWAVDPAYGKSMGYVASTFMRDFCKNAPDKPAVVAAAAPTEVMPWSVSPRGTVRAAPRPAMVPSAVPAPKVATKPLPKLAVAPKLAVSTPTVAQAASAPTIVTAPTAQALVKSQPADADPRLLPSLIPAATLAPAAAAAPVAMPTGNVQDRAAIAPSQLGMSLAASPCLIKAASYGNSRKTVLVKSKTANGEPLFVALGVLEGFEQSMTDSFLKSQPVGAEAAGEFSSKADALAKATEICQAG